MWVCVHGDLGMRQWHRVPEGFSLPEALTQLQHARFPRGDEICSDGCLKKQPYAAIGIQASEERCLDNKAMDPIRI